MNGVEGHDFGEGGNLSNIFVSVCSKHFEGGVLHHDETLCFNPVKLLLLEKEQGFLFLNSNLIFVDCGQRLVRVDFNRRYIDSFFLYLY